MNLDEILKNANYDISLIDFTNLNEDRIIELIDYDEDVLIYIPKNKVTKKIVKIAVIKYNTLPYNMRGLLADEVIEEILEESPYSFSTLQNQFTKEKRDYFFKKIENKISNVNNDSPELFRKSPVVALKSIEKDVNKLNCFFTEALTPEVINKAISLGYKYDEHLTSIYVLSNEAMMMEFMKDDVQIFNKARGSAITKRTIDYAFNHGFKLEKNSILLKFKEFVLEIVKFNPDLLNEIDESIVDIDIAREASKHGYCFRLIGDREPIKVNFFQEVFSDDQEPIYNNNLFLLNYDELVLSSYKNGYDDIIFSEYVSSNNDYYEWILANTIEKNIVPNHIRNTNLLNDSKALEYIYNLMFKDSTSRKYLEKYMDIFGIKSCFLNIKNLSLVLNPNFIKEFDDNKLKLLIKYIIITDSNLPLENVLNSISISLLKKLMDFKEKADVKTFYPVEFSKLIYYLNSNINLTKELNVINNDYLRYLWYLIDANESCNSIKDLSKVKQSRYENIINNNDLDIKDKIYKVLCGSSKFNVKSYLESVLDYKKIKFLNISSKYQKYIDIICLLDKVKNSDDNTVLVNILKSIKSYNPISMDELYAFAANVFTNIYNLTNINNLKVSEYIDGVPIIHFTGEKFSFISHALNSFNKAYAVEYYASSFFKDEDGKPYMCNSYDSDIHIENSYSPNGIYLVFDLFSPEQLISISNKSVHLKSKDNNPRNIVSEQGNWIHPMAMSALSEKYNEFDFYRDNNNGELLVPKALKAYDNVSKEQLKQAKGLNLPIIVVHREKYIERNMQLYDKYKSELLQGDTSNIEYLLCLSRSLNLPLSNEELDLIVENSGKENLDSIMYLFEIYKYDYKKKVKSL